MESTMLETTLNGFEAPERPSHVIIHPLFDEPEAKVDVRALGPMKLSRGARIALSSLRVYFIAMVLLAAYRVLDFAGLFGKH